MKAKEWAAKLLESPDNRDEVLKAFVEEIGTVAKQRGGSPNAVEGAVREQRAKWQAVCRECPSVDAGLFEAMLESHGQEYRKAVETAKAQAARQGPPGQEGAGRNFAGRKPGLAGREGRREPPQVIPAAASCGSWAAVNGQARAAGLPLISALVTYKPQQEGNFGPPGGDFRGSPGIPPRPARPDDRLLVWMGFVNLAHQAACKAFVAGGVVE